MNSQIQKSIDAIAKVFSGFHAGESACDESVFLSKIEHYVRAEKTIPFVILAFPCKSINPESVTGHLPDMGEARALGTLRTLIKNAGEVYAPGIEIHVVSEGHCFTHTGCVRPVNEVDDYVSELRKMKASDRIHVHTLHDFYPNGLIDEKLAHFNKDYLPPASEVETLISKENSYFRRHYVERLAFIYHEFSPVLFPNLSGNRRHAWSKITARHFIACELAVARMVDERMSDMVRLSIHRQHDPLSKKYYINLLPGVEGNGTPWFYTLRQDGERAWLAKRIQVKMQRI